ncbi:hypothetical protein DKE43_11120 [Bacillus pumilus]|nr:hypothetical protein DKE43_11120 [Bacillus pumilus]PRS52223.1 hypothetical protein C6Y00_08630 [Bacillus sp. GBSC66]PRS72228.1 hypothetical protein C6347_04140 [Bacillus sp. NMTD17]
MRTVSSQLFNLFCTVLVNFHANFMQLDIIIHFKPFKEMALYQRTGFIVNQFIPFRATLTKFEMEGSIG